MRFDFANWPNALASQLLKRFMLAATISVVAFSQVGLSQTLEKAQMSGNHPAATGEFFSKPVLTIGEGTAASSFNQNLYGYEPVGIPDGMGAYLKNFFTVRVLLNHELGSSAGYPYSIGAGPTVTGARISQIDINRFSRKITSVGPAYTSVYDRSGALVTTAEQINEAGSTTRGFERFCSANLFEKGSYNLPRSIYITGEETSKESGHAHGGSFWMLDIATNQLWGAPELGRGTWEGATFVDPPARSKNMVAALLADDFGGAPLYLYIGMKRNTGSALDRCGLSKGQLYVWVADDGAKEPADFNGTGTKKKGTFVPINARDVSKAGTAGYDALGYKDDTTLRSEAQAMGAFKFSRPEDLQTNPKNGKQVAFASTGNEAVTGDLWSMTYKIDMKLEKDSYKAEITILNDGNEDPDHTIRSADNLCWARDGFVYVQEDRSVAGFGASSGIEASIWKLDPATYDVERIAVIDRTAVPTNQVDASPSDVGNWESSGVIDVSHLFPRFPRFYDWPEETLLIANVQAHSVRSGGRIDAPNAGGRNANLVEGGQVYFLSNSLFWKLLSE